MGPFQNKGDFRKSKDALGREISVRNCTTFGHMAPAASEKNVIFDNFYVEVGIAVYTCRCCFCAKSAPPDLNSAQNLTFYTRLWGHMAKSRKMSGMFLQSNTENRCPPDHLYSETVPYQRHGSDPLTEI